MFPIADHFVMAGTLDEVLWLLQLPRMIRLHERILRSFSPHEAIPFVAIPVCVGFMHGLFFRAGLVGLFCVCCTIPVQGLVQVVHSLYTKYFFLSFCTALYSAISAMDEIYASCNCQL